MSVPTLTLMTSREFRRDTMTHLSNVMGFFSLFLSKKPQRPVGFVEELDASSLRGWAHFPEANHIDLKLQIGQRTIDLRPTWVSRNDVAASLGVKPGKCGFVCQFDIDTSEQLDVALDNGVAVKVLANGQVLPLVPSARKPRTSLNWERLDVHQRSEWTESCIEFGGLHPARMGDRRWRPAKVPHTCCQRRGPSAAPGVVRTQRHCRGKTGHFRIPHRL